MKKFCIQLLAIILVFSFAACTAAPAKETPSPTQETTAEQLSAATPEPTPKPTQTPEPTMAPEEMANLERFQALKRYCDDYGDEYSALLLRDMYEAGEITEKQYQSVALTESFRYLSGDMFKDFKSSYERTSKIINGEMEYVNSDEIDEILSMIDSFAEKGIVFVSLYKNEQKERLLTALDLINKWYENPTDETREAVEDMYFSEELTPGETMQLFFYMIKTPNKIKKIIVGSKTYDIEIYINDTIIKRFGESMGGKAGKAYEALIEQNNTPFSEKTWCTYPERPVVLTAEELAEILDLSDTAFLKYCWEHYGDEYAVVQMAQLYEKGIITDSEFSQDLADVAARISDIKIKMYENAKAAVNATETLDDTNLRQAICSRRAYLRNGKITISLFDTREKQERVINGINLIRAWMQNPTNENKKAFESFMLSDELTPGEYIFLYEYMEYYGDYLPMHINVAEVRMNGRESFLYDYLGGFTLQSQHTLANMYKQYTDYKRLMVEMDYDM